VTTHRRNPKSTAAPSDRRRPRAVALIAHAAWARRQFASLMAGLLLLGGGLMLPNPMVLVSGLVIVGLSAPRAAPSSPQGAMVQTWRSLHRRRPLTPSG
jgi:hypothetical protein